MLAGDIVYGMGHDAPRSERSTGQMVRGSDVDLVVITEGRRTGGARRSCSTRASIRRSTAI